MGSVKFKDLMFESYGMEPPFPEGNEHIHALMSFKINQHRFVEAPPILGMVRYREEEQERSPTQPEYTENEGERLRGFSGGSVGKTLPASAGDLGLIPVWEDPTRHEAAKPLSHNN